MRSCRQNGLAFKQGEEISKEYDREVHESHYFHKIITRLLKHLKKH
jgi:hypothetical protein